MVTNIDFATAGSGPKLARSSYQTCAELVNTQASGDIAHARVPVDVAERMFGLDFALLSHPRSSVQIARARSAGAAPLEASPQLASPGA